jgi:hypothetical protein
VPPILVLAAAAFSQLATSQPYCRTATALLQFFTVVSLIGLPATFAFSALAGSSVALAILTVRALMLFLLVLASWELLNSLTTRQRFRENRLLAVWAIPLLIFSLWSVGSAGAAAFQASAIAQGGPYCIGDTQHPGFPYGEIDSVTDLRGVDLFTASEEYNPDSYWHFHAILIAPENEQSVFWNWSIRRMAFTAVSERTRRLLDHPIARACEPKVNFISWLLWPF